jgi:hypothetical protein
LMDVVGCKDGGSLVREYGRGRGRGWRYIFQR